MTSRPLVIVVGIEDAPFAVEYLRSLEYNTPHEMPLGDVIFRYGNRWEVVNNMKREKLVITEEKSKVQDLFVPLWQGGGMMLACPNDECQMRALVETKSEASCPYCQVESRPFWQEHLGWHLVEVSGA